MPMTTSFAGRATLMRREGCRLAAYKDSVGVWTIGVGHTGRAGGITPAPGMTVTQAQADALFEADLVPFEAAVGRAVTVPLTQDQFDACVSLAFNLGATAFAASTVVRQLNAGNVPAAADAFLLWNRPAELKPRRLGERAQFLAEASLPPRAAVASPGAARPKPGARPRFKAAVERVSKKWRGLFRRGRQAR